MRQAESSSYRSRISAVPGLARSPRGAGGGHVRWDSGTARGRAGTPQAAPSPAFTAARLYEPEDVPRACEGRSAAHPVQVRPCPGISFVH